MIRIFLCITQHENLNSKKSYFCTKFCKDEVKDNLYSIARTMFEKQCAKKYVIRHDEHLNELFKEQCRKYPKIL